MYSSPLADFKPKPSRKSVLLHSDTTMWNYKAPDHSWTRLSVVLVWIFSLWEYLKHPVSQTLSICGFQSLLPGQKQWQTRLGFYWDFEFGAVPSHCPTVAILSLDLPCHFHSKPLQIPENNAFLPSVLSAFPILTYVWVELMPKAWRKPRSTKVHLSEKATCSILSLNRLQHQSRLEPVSALWSDVLSWATSKDHGPATCLHISRQMCNLSV